MKHGGRLGLLLLLPLLVLSSCFLAIPVLFGAPPANACPGTGAAAVDVGPIPGGSIAGYSGQQLADAAKIMQAAKDKGLDQRAQTIGVMTAMGESGIRPLGYGDAAGPDSRGYFQQRDSWGPLAVRLDPYGSAGLFYDALVKVPGWQSMTPTGAAHAVQRNADPNYYTPFWDKAVQVVSALAGVPVTVTPGQGGTTCGAAGPGLPVGPGGLVKPVTGVLTSGFSPNRLNPVTGVVEAHLGQDIGAPCGTPEYAAEESDVISAGPATGFGDWIRLQGTDGTVFVYGHEFPDGLLVHVGDHVKAGQQVGLVGSNGQATGCHLHFEVHPGGGPAVDPVPWMTAHGAPL